MYFTNSLFKFHQVLPHIRKNKWDLKWNYEMSLLNMIIGEIFMNSDTNEIVIIFYLYCSNSIKYHISFQLARASNRDLQVELWDNSPEYDY